VRKGLGLDHFYLLGHSWGGMLAELYTAKYGQHVKGLILSNVPGFFNRDRKYIHAILDSVDNVVRYKATLLPRFKNNKAQIDSVSKGLQLPDTMLNKMLAKQFNKAADSLFNRSIFYHQQGKMPGPLIRNSRHTRYESIEKNNFNPFDADYAGALQQIKTPTLVIGGKYDFVHPELYDTIKKVMAKAKVKVFICPGGAHFSMWDDSENYFRELNRFISEVNSGKFTSY